MSKDDRVFTRHRCAGRGATGHGEQELHAIVRRCGRRSSAWAKRRAGRVRSMTAPAASCTSPMPSPRTRKAQPIRTPAARWATASASEELEHVALLAVTTIGWSGAIKGLSWVRDVTRLGRRREVVGRQILSNPGRPLRIQRPLRSPQGRIGCDADPCTSRPPWLCSRCWESPFMPGRVTIRIRRRRRTSRVTPEPTAIPPAGC